MRHFQQYGVITEHAEYSGRLHITYQDVDSASDAIRACHGFVLMGSPLRCWYAIVNMCGCVARRQLPCLNIKCRKQHKLLDSMDLILGTRTNSCLIVRPNLITRLELCLYCGETGLVLRDC